jgi:hypothetical protein
MEQNYIINFANELMNNLYPDISNNTYQNHITDISSLYMFRPININYISQDTSRNNASFLSNYLQYTNTNTNTNTNNIIYDSSYITIATLSNIYNSSDYPRAVSLRNILRTLFINYYEEDDSNTFLETFINSTFNNEKKFKKVISDSELEKLIPQKFNRTNETTTNSQCPILCYNFEENEEIIKLPCNHNYNCEAIIKWLSQESNTCPVCRFEFDYKEISINSKTQDSEQNTNTEYESMIQESQESQQSTRQSLETTNFYNLFSEEEILMQEILLSSYSNSNSNSNI